MLGADETGTLGNDTDVIRTILLRVVWPVKAHNRIPPRSSSNFWKCEMTASLRCKGTKWTSRTSWMTNAARTLTMLRQSHAMPWQRVINLHILEQCSSVHFAHFRDCNNSMTPALYSLHSTKSRFRTFFRCEIYMCTWHIIICNTDFTNFQNGICTNPKI